MFEQQQLFNYYEANLQMIPKIHHYTRQISLLMNVTNSDTA